MIYSFGSEPDKRRFRTLVQEYSGLTEEQLQWIREYGDNLPKTSVKLTGLYDETRVKARGSHFVLNDETEWVYEAMASVSIKINSENYKLDIRGFGENFYYHTYDGSMEEHFGWHVDAGYQNPEPRKLSLVLQLSGPEEYAGGEFEVMTPTGELQALKRKGYITAFPSSAIHRVRAVTKGVRRSLVVFAAGPYLR